MKLLIMCEGSNELEIIKILLENNCFNFNQNDLLGLVPYHARQIDLSSSVKTALNLYPGKDVIIYRIGDKQSDKLRIPKTYQEQIIGIRKYCTLPELEVLLIIADDKYTEFRSNRPLNAKQFAKNNIRCNGERYDNSSRFYRDYFGNDPQLLVQCIRKYRELNGAHDREQLYLADLLR